MAIAGSNIPLNNAEGEDKITVTEKVTTAYFSDGSTQLDGGSINSSSLADSNETYYYGISKDGTESTVEFNVTYGHIDGNGGDDVDNTVKSPTEVIYKQWANLLLPPTEVTGGFFISSKGSAGVVSSVKDSEIYVMSARRSLMKDRLNKKNWTIKFSGSLGTAAGADLLELTDDSVDDSPTATPVGDRYNIVSGSDGTVARAATEKTYGWFYPDIGVLVFSGQELSASMPGSSSAADSVVVYNHADYQGFGATTNQDNDYASAVRFINCLRPTGSVLKFRDEEDQVSAQYFCRVKSGHMNFSNNPTFVSGSLNELRHTTMKGNPTTFISQVQMFNAQGDMVAIGNLSTPLKKNFSSEATIKVKLTY
mgnify:CR=1 FL=1